MVSALRVSRHGPLIWATYVGGRGFVVYERLEADSSYLTGLVDATIAHYSDVEDGITEVEWKARGHDEIPDLDEVLRRFDFRPDEPESVMMGEALAMALDVPVPDGVSIRRVASEQDVRRMCAMQAEVFDSADQSEPILHRLSLGNDDLELWVAEVRNDIVSAGRLEPMAGTEVAGIWAAAPDRSGGAGASTGR